MTPLGFFWLFFFFFNLALISAEDLPPECATDAQMWCLSDAPSPHDKSPVSHLPTCGILYDIGPAH